MSAEQPRYPKRQRTEPARLQRIAQLWYRTKGTMQQGAQAGDTAQSIRLRGRRHPLPLLVPIITCGISRPYLEGLIGQRQVANAHRHLADVVPDVGQRIVVRQSQRTVEAAQAHVVLRFEGGGEENIGIVPRVGTSNTACDIGH